MRQGEGPAGCASLIRACVLVLCPTPTLPMAGSVVAANGSWAPCAADRGEPGGVLSSCVVEGWARETLRAASSVIGGSKGRER
jgi:hypothetical protein